MRLFIASATILISALFLFVNLGAYSLWDDEANTALIGEGVWRTGDTTAILDHNIVAYDYGKELVGTKARYLPPLQYYVVAPFVGLFDPSAALARLPFALIGFLTILLMLIWLYLATNDPMHWWLVCFGIVANVSFFLYCRQCRYYSLAIASTVFVTFLYYHWKGNWWEVFLLILSLLILLASNYLNFAALMVCLAIDYAIWGRARNPIRWKHMLVVLAPVILIGLIIVLIWNPMGKDIAKEMKDSWIVQHTTLLWWNLREINQNEFTVGLLGLAAPVVGLFVAQARFLWRLWLAAVIYVLAISILSPQPTSVNGEADVRYLVPLIPLFIAMNAAVLAVILAKHRKWIVPVSLILLGTNIANGGIDGGDNPREYGGQIAGFASTPIRYIHELIAPQGDPYRPTADWINANLAPRESVFVWFDQMNYPLMFHAPGPIYAWQLFWPPKDKALESLPAINFNNRELPMYIVLFGPAREDLIKNHGFTVEPSYMLAKQIDVSWFYTHRPEIMWRDFPGDQKLPGKKKAFDSEKDAVYIYVHRRQPA